MTGRILFVDDEPDLLAGLRNLLRRHRHRWEMEFLGGGERGLEALETRSFDAVVSDMRMPGMDGPAFLREVKVRHPDVSRVVLSGQADRTSLLGILGTAQVFLSKPCPGDVLTATLEQCLAVRQIVTSSEVRRAIGKVDRLPSPPDVYWTLMRLIEAGGGEEAMASTIREDIGTSVKLLQIVNSAYFAPPTPILSIESAIRFAGPDSVKSVLLALEALWEAPELRARHPSVDLEGMALATARLARRMTDDPRAKDEAFAAGLLHDLGKLVLAKAFPESFALAVEGDDGRASWQSRERDAMGVTHTEAGAYLVGTWGLPMSIVSATAHHHDPSAAAESPLLTIIHVADALVHAALGRAHEAPLDEALVEARGLRDRLSAWTEMACEETAAVGGRMHAPGAVRPAAAPRTGEVPADDERRCSAPDRRLSS